MKVYLCGPINGCTDEECKDWRDAIKKTIGEDHTLDPMRRDYRGVEDEKYEEIVEGDLDDIKDCDVLLVNAPSASWGTAMEIREAFLQQKPIIVVHPVGMRISPWLRYHASKLFTTFDDAVAWLVDNCEINAIAQFVS